MPISEQAGTPSGMPAAGRIEFSPVHGSQYATAGYIMDLSGQLARLADDAGLDLLSYLLDMVQIEAKRTKKRVKPPVTK